MTAASPPVLGGVAPYLSVSNAGKAADFYKKAFGANEVMRVPPDEKGRYLHIHLRDQWRLGDAGRRLPRPRPSAGERPAPSCCISRSTTSTPGGSARSRPAPRCCCRSQEMFWGDRYGQLRDPFGVKWSIATPIKKS